MCGGSLQQEYPILSLLMLSPIHLVNWWWKSIHTGCNQKDGLPQDNDDDDHNKLFTLIATRTDSLWQTPTWLLQADFHWRRLWGKMPFAQWLNSDLMYQQLHNAQLHYERYVDFLTWCTLSSLWIVGDIVPSPWSDSGLDWVAPQVLLLGNVTSWDDCEMKSTHHFSRSSCASWISKEILSSQLPATAPHCRHQTIMSLLNWTLHSFHLDPSRTWIEHGFPKASSIWLCLALQSRSFLPSDIQHERQIWKIRT